MIIAVKLFGPQAQLAGKPEVSLTLPDGSTTCAALQARLAEAEPRLAATLGASRFAVNHEFVDADHEVVAQDEVALIAMVSGG